MDIGPLRLKTRYCPQNHLDLDWFYTIRSQPNPLDEQQRAVRRGHIPPTNVAWVRVLVQRRVGDYLFLKIMLFFR